MALDTRNKRASALACGLDVRVVRPVADGFVDGCDRQHATWLYCGIVTSVGVARVILQAGFVWGPVE